jgi:hypothetical protein
MATRATDGAINLPRVNRQSVPVTGIPQVDIPLANGTARAALGISGIFQQVGTAIGEIDRKNQQMAAEKLSGDILVETYREIHEGRANYTGDEDIEAIAGSAMSVLDRKLAEVDSRVPNSIQRDYIKQKLTAQRDNIGMSELDYGLKLKEKKYELDLSAGIDNAANIIATDPRLFKEQLASIEGLINNSRLDGVQKEQRLRGARELATKVYFTRLAELNPGKARAELSSKEMNALVDPAFKTSLLGRLDNEAKAKASIALNSDIQQIEQARRLGVAVPRELIEQTATRVRAAGNEKTALKLEKYAGLQDYAVELSQKSLADQEMEIRELGLKVKLGDLSDLDRLEIADETYREKIKGVTSDPWGYYTAKGVLQEEPGSLLDASAESAAVILENRRLAQEKVKQLEGGKVRLPLLRPQEIAQLSAMKETADPKQLAATLTTIGSTMNGAERRATVAAVAAKEPMLAVAMGKDFNTASRLLAGSKADGEVSKAKVREKAAEKLKGIAMDGSINDALNDAVFAYYKQLALEKGETSKEVQSDILDQAVRDVVGDIVDVNIGRPSRVIAPQGMTAEQVEDRLFSIDDALLKEQQGQLPETTDRFRVSARQIALYGQFLSAGNGVVAVRFPDGILRRDDGRLYTIDIGAMSEDSIRSARQARLVERMKGGM